MLQIAKRLGCWSKLYHGQSGAFWIFSERVLSSVLNLLCIVAITRFLGPTPYGHWAFALSVVGVLLATGHLGLDGLLIKKIVDAPDRAAHLLGTVVALKAAIYIPAIVGVLLFFHDRPAVTAEEQKLLFILMIPVIMAPLTSSLLAWTNATSEFGKPARSRIAANVTGTTAKLLAVFAGFDIVSVGYIHAAMFVLEALLLLLVVGSQGGPLPWHWRPDLADVRPLLRQSGYLFAATIFAILYFNTDIMMMRLFRGPYEVGTYALVPQIIQAIQLIPYALTLSTFPALVALAGQSQDLFHARILSLTKQLFLIAALVAVALVGFAAIGFELIFGAAYKATIPALMIGALSLPFLFIRQLTTKIYICTNQGRRLAVIELVGLLLSIGLNLILIPRFGGLGAISVLCLVCFFTVVISLLFFEQGSLVRRMLR
ncbi:flippase [Sphingopyxis sp. NJF-3]